MNAESPRDRVSGAKRRPATVIRSLLVSPTTTSAVFFALMGIGFSGAHLALARVLPTLEYAVVALAVAVVNLAAPFAPLGSEGIVLRHRLEASRGVLSRAFRTSALVGVGVAVGAAGVYDLDAPVSVSILVAIAAGGVTKVAAAIFQSRQAFRLALVLNQSSNLFLLTAACVIVVSPIRAAWFAIALVAGGHLVAGAWSWNRLLREARQAPTGAADYPWRESVSFLVVNGAAPALLQAERLMIPKVLSLEDLATFGVLAAIVMAPYRTLQMGAVFTVLPRLRAATTAAQRRRLFAKEAVVLTVVATGGGGVLALLAPWLVEAIFRGKYVIPHGLLVAAILGGCVKAYSGLAKAAAMALCTTRELAVLGGLVWLSVAIALVGAAVGASWGLEGFVLGIAAGWLTLLVAYLALAVRHLRRQ